MRHQDASQALAHALRGGEMGLVCEHPSQGRGHRRAGAHGVQWQGRKRKNKRCAFARRKKWRKEADASGLIGCLELQTSNSKG